MPVNRTAVDLRLLQPFSLLIFVIFLFFSSSPALATPFTWGDKVVAPPAFPKNSTINVYIKKDPKHKGRDGLVKEGVERWKKTLADRMVTLNVNIGDVPAGTENAVPYTWEEDGFTSGEDKLGTGEGEHDGIGTTKTDGDKLTGGSAHLRNDLPADTQAEKDLLKNLGEHELTHVLGLADDDAGVVTNHNQTSDARTYNDQDKKEINLLYATANTGGTGKPQGAATNTGGGSTLAFFQYTFQFDPANVIADPDDPEHVSLITFDIDPDLITGIDLPEGWIALIGDGSVDRNDPFFDGYMVDGFGEPAPWDPDQLMTYISLRSLTAESALSLTNPELFILFHTIPNVLQGPIELWAGAELQTVSGPQPVPEPGTLALVSLGVLGMGSLRRKNRVGKRPRGPLKGA
jgi:hypothetical protein